MYHAEIGKKVGMMQSELKPLSANSDSGVFFVFFFSTKSY